MSVAVAVLALAAVCVAMRVTVPLLLGERRPARLDRSLAFAVPALLAALVVTGALVEGRSVEPDPRVAGVAAAAAVAVARGPLLVAVIAAAAVTAGLRAL
jgi:branched-subunit amino acid transport protein